LVLLGSLEAPSSRPAKFDAPAARKGGGQDLARVYLLLRQILQMLTQLARDGGA
jgi:hypothetical protein